MVERYTSGVSNRSVCGFKNILHDIYMYICMHAHANMYKDIDNIMLFELSNECNGLNIVTHFYGFINIL